MARRVRNEVALHRRLRHPNILALYHHFEDDERVYLVMELCARGELFELLRRRREEELQASGPPGTLSENEARAVLRDIVSGLKFLHARNIIHRDLKLSNILLSGHGGQAKIADFGLAVDISATELHAPDKEHEAPDQDAPLHEHRMREQRTICGTPNYLAPEILDRRSYGKSADIWSLGCLLYSFLAGRPPFDSGSLAATFDRVRRLEYTLPEHISAPARDLITRLLQPEPSQRPTFDQIIWHPFFNPAVSLPLNTLRLQPLQQMTKYGSLELRRNDGSVWVDFLNASDVLGISADGLRVTLQPKSQDTRDASTWPISDLPEPCRRRYEYARRFVNLIKSKTPLVIIATPHFKAYLMENACVPGLLHSTSAQLIAAPVGDFYLHYRSEALRLEYCWISRQLRFIDTRSGLATLTLSDPSYLSVEEAVLEKLPISRKALLEFLARYQQALRIRDQLLHPDGRAKSGATAFPFVVREDSAASGSTGNASVLSAARPALSSSQLSLSSAFMPQTGTSSGANGNDLPLRLFNRRRHLPDVGWCLQVDAQDSFLVLFKDGDGMFVDGSCNVIVDGEGRRWPITTDLPDPLKHRLALFSRFL
jgi:serine/threonine protein kinase